MRAGPAGPEPDAAGLTALLSAGLLMTLLWQEEASVVRSDSLQEATHKHTQAVMVRLE